MLLLVSLLLPLISSAVVLPYLLGVAEQLPLLLSKTAWLNIASGLGADNLWITVIVLVALLAVLAVRLPRRPRPGNDSVYLSGVGLNSDTRTFSDALGQPVAASQRNWYLQSLFGEGVWKFKGNLVAALVLGICLLLALILEVGAL